MATDYDELQDLIPSLSPATTAGADPDDILSSGNPQAYMASMRAGQPFVSQNMGSAPSPGDASMLAAAVPSGTPPADNAPNPPSETPSGPQAVPGNVTQTGRSPWSPLAVNAYQKATSSLDDATKLANDPNQPNVNAIQAARTAAASPQSATNPTGAPVMTDPNHPEYKPSIGRRILRGVVGAGVGLAGGGIRGALLGALEPQATTGVGYKSPTRAFSIAAQQNAGRLANLDEQLKQADTQAKTGDEAAKNLLEIAKGYTGVGKDAAANQNADTKADVNRKALAAAGLKLSDPDDPNSKPVDDPDSEVFKDRQAFAAVRTSQKDLNEAKTNAANADPTTAAGRAAIAKLKAAEDGHAASVLNAQARMMQAHVSSDRLDFEQEKFFNPQPTSTERTKKDLADSAVDRVKEMRAIVAKHPEFFGPGGGQINKAREWLGSQDPDAQTYAAARNYLTEHSAGVFGGRGKYIIQELKDPTDPRFNPASLNAALDEAERTASGFVTAGTTHDAPRGNFIKPKGGAPKAPAGGPPQSVIDAAKPGQYIHGPTGSFQKQADGSLKPVTGGSK